jgi:hypothetical protein
MITSKNLLIVISAVIILVSFTLAFGYVEALETKNNLTEKQIESYENIRKAEILAQELQEREKQILEQAKFNLELEQACQIQITKMRSRYNNVENGGYNTDLGYCEIAYKDSKTGLILRADIQHMVSSEISHIRLNDHSYYYNLAPIIITGKVSSDTQKIIVTAVGKDYHDVYQLKNYKSGDKTFQYQMKENFGNLSQGTNEYYFQAFFKDGTSENAYLRIYYSP